MHISKNLPNVQVTYNIIIRCVKCFHKLSSLDISSSPWEKLFRKPRLHPRPLEKGHRPQTKLCQHSHMSGNICIAIVIILLYVHFFPQSFKYLKLKQTGVSLSSRILFSNKRICRKRHFFKTILWKVFSINILLRRVEFGIWLSNIPEKFEIEIFLWCLKAKFQIPLSAEGCLASAAALEVMLSLTHLLTYILTDWVSVSTDLNVYD